MLDLAYKIHSDIGDMAAWARVNKRSVALTASDLIRMTASISPSTPRSNGQKTI